MLTSINGALIPQHPSSSHVMFQYITSTGERGEIVVREKWDKGERKNRVKERKGQGERENRERENRERENREKENRESENRERENRERENRERENRESVLVTGITFTILQREAIGKYLRLTSVLQ